MKTKFNLKTDLPRGLKEATENSFRPISCSSRLNLGHEFNRKSYASGWFEGLEIGEATQEDQFGDIRTWEIILCQSSGIMMNVHNSSKWQIFINTK